MKFQVCAWIIGVLDRYKNGNCIEYFELLPFACHLERCENDLELVEKCKCLIAALSQALTLDDCMDAALNRIDEVSRQSSWSARMVIIDVLQVLVFNNLLTVLSRSQWVDRVQSIVLRLLEDPVIEVRVKAAEVLSGLLHCSFLSSTSELLSIFKRKCEARVGTNSTQYPAINCVAERTFGRNSTNQMQETESIRARHMGVLGLCAFINAFPYDIPDFVPHVFQYLRPHLDDPPPISVCLTLSKIKKKYILNSKSKSFLFQNKILILCIFQSTIRETFADFKRTHHDNWATHQLKFTKDQLAVLCDFTFVPSYFT